MNLIVTSTSYNKWIYFLVICLTAIAIAEYSEIFLVDDMLFIDHFKDQLSYDRIVEILDKQRQFFWMSYIFIPLIFFVKIIYASSAIYIGFFFKNIKVSFDTVFKVALFCEPIFFLPKIIKFIWFYFINTDYGLLDYRYYYPLSALNLVDVNDTSSWFIYPLQMTNVFEAMYAIVIAFLLAKILKMSFSKVLPLVLLSYIIGLLLWASIILFLTVTYS